jgi:uncharacterized protein YceK
MNNKIKSILLVLFLIGILFLSACSDIQSAIESKETKCAREREYCKADCNKLTDVFGCSDKCDKKYNACVM